PPPRRRGREVRGAVDNRPTLLRGRATLPSGGPTSRGRRFRRAQGRAPRDQRVGLWRVPGRRVPAAAAGGGPGGPGDRAGGGGPGAGSGGDRGHAGGGRRVGGGRRRAQGVPGRGRPGQRPVGPAALPGLGRAAAGAGGGGGRGAVQGGGAAAPAGVRGWG